MKKLALFICSLSFLVRAQPPTDSIPLRLVAEADPAAFMWEIPPLPYPWPPYDPWPHPWITDLVGYITWMIPPCGDTYHENGKRATYAECIDSVLHGKAIYWDETGHKIHEATYAEGHCIKSKYYDSFGRLSNVSHHDYQGKYHGICIKYFYNDDNYGPELIKTVTHYDHGLKHGTTEKYNDDRLITKDRYDQDTLAEHIEYQGNGEVLCHHVFQGEFLVENRGYNSDGKLTYLELKDPSGANSTLRQWSDDGILICEKVYVDSMPVGTFIDYYNLTTGQKLLSHFENGRFKKKEMYQSNFLMHEEFFDSLGVKDYEVSWYANGDSARYINAKNYTEKIWDKDGKLTTHYTSTEAQLFRESGFYTLRDTLYHIEVAENPHKGIPVKRWVVYNNDTLRMDYIVNNSENLFYTPRTIRASNKFIHHPAGHYVKHGVWKNYEGNQLESAITYDYGSLTGRAVYYAATDSSSQLLAVGFFWDGQKNGLWTSYTSTGTTAEMYRYGFLHGPAYTNDSLGNRISECMYDTNKLHGVFTTYYPKNTGDTTQTIRSVKIYVGNVLNGIATYYDEAGRLILEGTYENDIRIKNWFEYTYAPDGTVKRTKIPYRNGEPVL